MRGRSLQSTFEPYRPAKLRCSSAAWRSLRLQRRVTILNRINLLPLIIINVTMMWWWRSYPPRTPSPCRGVSWSQKSRTWRRQTGSRRTWGCLAPRRPVGSGSSGSGSACWSSSWRNAAGSPCDAPETRRYTGRRISVRTCIDTISRNMNSTQLLCCRFMQQFCIFIRISKM